MVWGVEPILNEELSFEHVPDAGSDWDAIQRFALTFDGYEHWGSFEKCGEIANESAWRYREEGVIPTTLEHLRTALFFEQRRWRHFGYAPGEESMAYIRALVGGIQEIVGRREAMEYEMEVQA